MDTQRVVALKSGDYQVFADVFEIFWDKVYVYLARKTKSTEVAKDLTQLVFIKLWKYRTGLSEEFTLNQQIFRKTRQVFIDWLRQEMRRQKYMSDNVAITEVPVSTSAHERLEIRNDVVNALQTLPPKRKQIFELRHIYGYSYKEIAELLGISTKTVDSQLSKANIQLRKILQASIFAAIMNDIINQMK